MTITLLTPLHDLALSSNISSSLKKLIDNLNKDKLKQYHIPKAHSFIATKNIFELLNIIIEAHTKEKRESNEKNLAGDSLKDNALHFLTTLEREGVSIENILIDHYSTLSSDSDLYVVPIFELVIDFIHFKKIFISNLLIEPYIEAIQQKNSYFPSFQQDEGVNEYFYFLNIIVQEKIKYDWFMTTLSVFTTGDNREGIYDQLPILRYSSQKQTFDYVSNHFPQQLYQETKYYSDLIDSDNTFSIKKPFQSIVTIKLFKYVLEHNLLENDIEHLNNIAQQLLKTMASAEFMSIIEKNIPVFNIEFKKNNSTLDIFFCTDTQDNLTSFEKMYVDTLQSIFLSSNDIKLRLEQDEYSDYVYCTTNMDIPLINKHYLFTKLNSEIENNNPVTSKKMKI